MSLGKQLMFKVQAVFKHIETLPPIAGQKLYQQSIEQKIIKIK